MTLGSWHCTRQMAFYANSLSAVKEARELLAKHKVPYKRPEDFFCDMLKSDEHMARVRTLWTAGHSAAPLRASA